MAVATMCQLRPRWSLAPRAVGDPPPPPPPERGSEGQVPAPGSSRAEPGEEIDPRISSDQQTYFRQRTRLAEALLATPSRVDNYFDRRLRRQWVWIAISFGAGFYCANTVSLSFGTLAVNDVVAAALTVGFCEAVSYVFYSAPRATLQLLLLNSFKNGVTAALITDALKLQS